MEAVKLMRGPVGSTIDLTIRRKGIKKAFSKTIKREIIEIKSVESKILKKNEGEVVKTENWGLLNLSYLIKKNKKGSYIHFKIKGKGNVVDELEKNEAIDKKLLRYLTIKVKEFDLDTNYFSKKDEKEKKESIKN